MITPRAYLFGFVGSCFYLIALVNTLPPFYYALTWLTAAVLASSLGIALLSLVGVTCEWSVSQTRVSENVASASSAPAASVPSAAEDDNETETQQEVNGPTIECKISNNGTLNKTDVLLEVHLHERWRDEILRRRFLLEVLPTGNSIITTLILHDLPRGRYRVTNIRLLGSDVLGLFRMQKSMKNELRQAPDTLSSTTSTTGIDDPATPDQGEIIIGPAMFSLALEHAGREAGAGHGGIQSTALTGLSDETRGTRPYVAGDDLRFVHWKSTARHGQLVVREFDRSSQRQAIVVWDGAAGTDHGEGEFSSAEQGLRLAASLCRAFFEHAQPCGLLRLDSRPLWVPPAGSSLRHSDSIAGITEALADADTAREIPLLTALSGFAGNLKAGSDLFLITTSLSPSVGQAALWGRARGLHVVIGLVDGAAFLKASEAAGRDASNDLLWRPVLQARVPHEQWEAGVDGSGATVVSRESYCAQEKHLRELGIPVALLTFAASPPTQNGPAQNGPAQNGSAQNGSAQNGSGASIPPYNPPALVRSVLREMLELRKLAGMTGGVLTRSADQADEARVPDKVGLPS